MQRFQNLRPFVLGLTRIGKSRILLAKVTKYTLYYTHFLNTGRNLFMPKFLPLIKTHSTLSTNFLQIRNFKIIKRYE